MIVIDKILILLFYIYIYLSTHSIKRSIIVCNSFAWIFVYKLLISSYGFLFALFYYERKSGGHQKSKVLICYWYYYLPCSFAFILLLYSIRDIGLLMSLRFSVSNNVVVGKYTGYKIVGAYLLLMTNKSGNYFQKKGLFKYRLRT